MNSLRTDDILGAKPRVRHMPKNLIRERAIPTSFLTNLSMNNPEPNSISNIYAHNQIYDSPIQYQNNDANSYPFYARNRLTKESRYVNYDFSRDQPNHHRDQKEVNTPNSNHQLNRASSENRYKPSSNYQQTRQNEDHSKEETNLRKKMDDSQSRSIASSRRSLDNKEQREESKRIFRGLGFNIITNHKFEYTFEHKLPNNF